MCVKTVDLDTQGCHGLSRKGATAGHVDKCADLSVSTVYRGAAIGTSPTRRVDGSSLNDSSEHAPSRLLLDPAEGSLALVTTPGAPASNAVTGLRAQDTATRESKGRSVRQLGESPRTR